MSTGYFVATRAALPQRSDGWQFTVGPVAVSVMDPADVAELAAVVPGTVAVLVLSSRAAAGEITENLAQTLARCLGAALLHEDGPEVLESFDPPMVPLSAASIEEAMRRKLATAQMQEREQRAREKVEWEAKMKENQHSGDNDWSDV